MSKVHIWCLSLISLALTVSLSMPLAAQSLEEEQAALEHADTPADGENAPTSDSEHEANVDDNSDRSDKKDDGPNHGVVDDIEQSDLMSDEQALAEEKARANKPRSDLDPFEEEDEVYLFLGLKYEHHFTPGFVLDIFLDEHQSASNAEIGAELTYRVNGFDMIVGVAYARYFASGIFRGKDEPQTETEFIDSELFALMVDVGFLWSTEINKYLEIQYGLQLGVGKMFGTLRRDEAYKDGNTFRKCNGEGNPHPSYCEVGGKYGEEDDWFSGGSAPALWFRFAPQVGLRIKPIKHVMIRTYGGFNVFSGFFAGASVAYGF